MKPLRRLLIIIAAAAGTAACTETVETSHADFAAIPVDGWAYGDTLELTPEPGDSVAEGRIAVAVRHTNGYAYRNLWLEVSTPRGDTLLADTVNVELADDYGRWLGRGSGVSYMTADTMPGRVSVTRGVPVRVRHIMRVDTLEDLEQIGIIFIPE